MIAAKTTLFKLWFSFIQHIKTAQGGVEILLLHDDANNLWSPQKFSEIELFINNLVMSVEKFSKTPIIPKTTKQRSPYWMAVNTQACKTWKCVPTMSQVLIMTTLHTVHMST